VLRVTGLTARFGSLPALTSIDLELGAGELLIVTGEPGAGKTTLVRCISGDLAPVAGEIRISAARTAGVGRGRRQPPTAVVWQDVALCESLDVATNLLLGHETWREMASDSRFHAAAAAILERFQIPIADTTIPVSSLSGAQRQLLAMARAMSARPRVLLLDEPTAALGLLETGEVEGLITRALEDGTSVILATRDIDQMFRLGHRMVVIRHGRVVAELVASRSHPDDVAALLSGQPVDSSARRQLTRLHGLADRLASADASSGLAMIVSTLGAALDSRHVCIHLVEGASLTCTASLGLAGEALARMSTLPVGPRGGPIGRAAATGQRVVEEDGAAGGTWSIPVSGPPGVTAVITVLRERPDPPSRDELDLLTLYAGYVASAVEHDRLLTEVTARNQVLETLREMLETLAGPAALREGLASALGSLREGLAAQEVAMIHWRSADDVAWRGFSGHDSVDPADASEPLRSVAGQPFGDRPIDGSARPVGDPRQSRILTAPFLVPGGAVVLLARWADRTATREETALVEDAAHSLRLALEREEAVVAQHEAAALRRSRELQRGFLSRLSHELRTPLTAIRGYATSLMAPDVTWDGDSQGRFLERIAAESGRLGRLVDDLLDFSAIESGVMRLQRDWCDLALVAEAAVACLPAEWAQQITVRCDPELPSVWGDHDRLEQVLLNLLSNAVRHTPPGTRVELHAAAPPGRGGRPADAGAIEICVSDDGPGVPAEVAAAPFEPVRHHRAPSAGAGLGLSIARGIVDAHGGSLELRPVPRGTTFRIRLPIEAEGRHPEPLDDHEHAGGAVSAALSLAPATVPAGADDA
jgi:signal transduction histidine kinase/ABC-type multidrug transport system ATPase subunit